MQKPYLQLDRTDNAGHTEQNDTNSIIINGPETSLACRIVLFFTVFSDSVLDMQTVLFLQAPNHLGTT